MEWFRWYHGAVSDDKWPLIARRSGQSIAVVIAVWASLLECASQADERGSIEDIDPESIDAHLQIDDGATQSVIDALSGGNRPRIVDGKILNWSKRQPVKEDDTSAERVRRYRERQKTEQKQKDETPCNADETPCNADETPCNADETPCNDRTEQTRLEHNRETTPPTPPSGGDGGFEKQKSKKSKPEKTSPKKPTGNSISELRHAIDEYAESEPLRKALNSFRDMRDRIRKPMTGDGIRLLFGKLDTLSGGDEATKVAIVEQSVMNSWLGLFPLSIQSGSSLEPTETLFEKNMKTGMAVLAKRQQRRAENEQQTGR